MPSVRDTLIVLLAYVVTLGAGATATSFAPVSPGLMQLFVLDGVATVGIFVIAVALGNSSLYDPYWSILPPVLVLGMLPFAVPGASGVRQALVFVLVTAWAARLTWNWYRGWTGFDHEDWRYGMLRSQSGPAWPLVNFFGIMVFPTLLVFAGCIAVWPAVAIGSAPLGAIDALAVFVTGGAILLEAMADEQLRAFRRSAAPGDVMQTGLWAWSRHPNYLGEIGFWCGLWVFGVAADPSWALVSLVGPVSMAVLFVGISIPMIERRMVERRPAYREVQQRIPFLVPWRVPR